ncbi:MAG: hypothetical protein IJS32_08715 [Kiritimatiellae bacterium]|nr:hypothetical protein [Kiritimatiellia bacterium]
MIALLVVASWCLGRWSAMAPKRDAQDAGNEKRTSAIPDEPNDKGGRAGGIQVLSSLPVAVTKDERRAEKHRPPELAGPLISYATDATSSADPSPEEAPSFMEARAGKEEWHPAAADPEAIAFVREAFSRWRDSDRNDDATAALRLSLGELSAEQSLAVASALFRAGAEQDRKDALWLVASQFSATPGQEEFVQSNVPDDAPGEVPQMPDPADEAAFQARLEQEAQETHDIMALVSAGMEDPSGEVRNMALDVASSLPSETSSVLCGQLLCSDSPVTADLRERLLQELDGRDDEGAVTLLVQAMQSPDESVAASARKNLESLSGLDLPTIDAVAEWLESREPPADGLANETDATTKKPQP